jgi:DNA-binding CsgD family transcriptional regulator
MWPETARNQLRLGAARIRTGERDAAGEALRAARSTARQIGMVPLVDEIDRLARAARITLTTGPEPEDRRIVTPARPRDPWGLSEREREVLALVATGRTNAEIGASLFISPKTASVHVTHILDKLGVSSRTEAALRAAGAGILGDVPGPGAAGYASQKSATLRSHV